MKSVHYSGLTDTGRQREQNEDSFRIAAEHGIALLADGMGGHSSGEVASDLAVSTAHFILNQTIGISAHDRLETAIQAAHHSVIEKAAESSRYRGMGTTIVATLLEKNTLHFAHVGDSRLYQWRKNRLTQLTIDHSLMQEYINKKLYSPEEARQKVARNILTRALGLLEGEFSVDIGQVAVQSNDRYLLCSDGLYEMMSDDDIAALLSQNTKGEICCEALIELANARGGKDNITVVLIDIP